MSKLWAFITVVFALVIAILAITLPQAHMRPIFVITTFFDVMIPILAVGAIVKYLCCCNSKCNSNNG